MRFTKPATAGSSDWRPGSGVHSRPDWLKEWIQDKGQYVKLECGHRLDLNGEVTLTTVDGTRQVWCYQHEEVVGVGKPIGIFEFHYGFPPPPTPDEPPY